MFFKYTVFYIGYLASQTTAEVSRRATNLGVEPWTAVFAAKSSSQLNCTTYHTLLLFIL